MFLIAIHKKMERHHQSYGKRGGSDAVLLGDISYAGRSQISYQLVRRWRLVWLLAETTSN